MSMSVSLPMLFAGLGLSAAILLVPICALLVERIPQHSAMNAQVRKSFETNQPTFKKQKGNEI